MSERPAQSLTLPVLGMTCASCQHHVEQALKATAGVESARVDLMAHRASVVFDPALAAPEQLVEAIRGAGYDAVLPRAGDTGPHAQDALADSGRKAWITLVAGALAMLLAMPLGGQMSAPDRLLMRVLPWLYALAAGSCALVPAHRHRLHRRLGGTQHLSQRHSRAAPRRHQHEHAGRVSAPQWPFSTPLSPPSRPPPAARFTSMRSC